MRTNGSAMGRIYGLVACAALLTSTGCRLDRRTELLEDQYLVARLDNTIASQAHLEEEYRRELSHVNELNAEVAELMAQEEVLALEAGEANARILEAQARLDEVEAARLAAEEAAEKSLAAEKAKVAELLGEQEATRTPVDRAGLEARIAALEAELARLGQVLAQTPVESPPADPPADEPANDPPAEGGGAEAGDPPGEGG